ncbi:head GIN domain-containing protein [Perlabentimonas gracilis]|uniref:head GIN domain-containing protein n=1 Tax=Perlabentimonas gracilis TaxID=2715279 RepID=UPI00140BC3E1|nr:head GIN domain-containing protein [Perlabentimonas gracilis]NHB69111.1 DUF2807 domain-containing protein [Perlabentimonas gracilis]
MKTKTIVLITLFALACTGLALGQTQKGKRIYDISEVETISINIACQLVVVQGNKPNIEILGEEYLLKEIDTNIRNGKATLTSDWKWRSREDVVVKIEISDLKQLNIGGAVDMKTIRTLTLPEFRMVVSGVGNIEMDLTSDSFRLTCSGVCNMDVRGSTEYLRISVSGVGNINATELKATNAKVSNSGVGKVNVLATEMLEATVSGIGSIRYAGNPMVKANISGLGSVKKY